MYRTLFLSNKLISYEAFYVGPIQTGFLMTFRKSYSGTGIMIPVKKNATGMENAGIRRIPAGICNLASIGRQAASSERLVREVAGSRGAAGGQKGGDVD